MIDRLTMLHALKRASIREIDVAGIKFLIRGLTGAERQEFVARQAAAKDDPSKKMTDHEFCTWGICDPDGERMFKDGDELSGVDGKTIETIALAILDASGLTPDAKETASGELPASPS